MHGERFAIDDNFQRIARLHLIKLIITQNAMSDLLEVECFKCNMCDSWQMNLRQMRQHFERHHTEVQVDSLHGFQSSKCARTGTRNAWRPIHTQAPVQVAADTWRTQSLFAQRSLFGASEFSVPIDTMRLFFPPKKGSGLHNEIKLLNDIRKEVKQFLDWIRSECIESWSCDLRNRMSSHGFKPIQDVSYPKYLSTLTAFVYFCRHCPWTMLPSNPSAAGILWSALSETKTEIRAMYMAEKFFLYSYACMGRGESSRDLAFISSDCAYLKYGLRGGFLHYCLKIIANTDVSGMNDASRFLSVTESCAFKQVSNLKNTANSCMPVTSHQPISWTPETNYSSLTVLSVGVTLTHETICHAFSRILEFVGSVLDTYGVPKISVEQFRTIKDSPTSTHAGEGLVGFNPSLFSERDAWVTSKTNVKTGKDRDNFFNDSYACANHFVAGIHLSAGPGFRGTEDASLLLVNSLSQSPRNIRAIGQGKDLQFCVIPVYSKQRPLSNGQPGLVAKFLPVELAFLLGRYIYFFKHLEGIVSGQTSNCATFLVTNCGNPVDFGTYNYVLNSVFRSIGIAMGISDLRHALEGFARHLPCQDSSQNTSMARHSLFANHSAKSSHGYGRDDFTVATVDADILEQDERVSHSWNTQILKYSNRLSGVMDLECETILKRKAPDTPSTFTTSCVTEAPAKRLFGSEQPALGCLTAAPAQFPLSQLQFHCIEFINETTVDSAVVIPTGSGKTRIIEMFGSRTGVSVAISPFSKLSTQLQTTLGEGVFRWPLSCSEEYCIQNAKKIVVAIEHCEYNSAFIYFLTRLNERRRITKFFVDEVHHLLQAGNPEFRRCLGNFWTFRSRLVELNIRAQVVGLTATLRNCDVQLLCQLLTGIFQPMPIFRRSCYRSSITMELIWAHGDAEAQKKCVESSLMDAQIGKTIVFSTTLNIVNSVASELRCQAVTSGISLDAAAFEATNLISASSCAGHGLDLKDIMIVAILGVPFDVETLLQWAGRIRKTGKVKIFLNETLVKALSRRQDRRGELARVFLENKEKGTDLQRECCDLIDHCGQVRSSPIQGFEEQSYAASLVTVLEKSGRDNTQSSKEPSLVFGLKDVVNLKHQLLAFMASIPSDYCSVCYILGVRSGSECGTTCRKFAGICIRCFQKHSYKDCKNNRFAMPGNSLCYKCFLPFQKGIGPDLHPCEIGPHCTTSMCDVLPRVVFILYHSNSVHIPSNLHGCCHKFLEWLATMDRQSGLFGILTLLKQVMM